MSYAIINKVRLLKKVKHDDLCISIEVGKAHINSAVSLLVELGILSNDGRGFIVIKCLDTEIIRNDKHVNSSKYNDGDKLQKGKS